MSAIVDVLKKQAHTLHKQVQKNDALAIARVKSLSEMKQLSDLDIVMTAKRRHCLKQIAVELGFKGWAHALRVIEGTDLSDYGTMFYPKGCGAHSNIWCATYEEAKNIRSKHGGFLLAYKNQFLVVDDDYIWEMGLNPNDPVFDATSRDWVNPGSPALHERLMEIIVPAVHQRNLSAG
jgi:hypothetical protein